MTINIPRTVLKSVVDIIFGITLFMALEVLAGSFIEKYALFFVIGGTALALFSRRINRAVALLHDDLLQITGGILLFIGLKVFIVQYIEQYVWYFLIGSFIGLFAANKIVDLIRRI